MQCSGRLSSPNLPCLGSTQQALRVLPGLFSEPKAERARRERCAVLPPAPQPPYVRSCQIAEGCGASRAAYPGVGCGALPGTRGRAVVGMGTVVSRGRAVSAGCACPQPAGAAAAALPAPEGAGAGREAGGDAAHLLPLLPVPRHAELPARHAQGGERGSGRGARGLRCWGRVAPRSPRLGAGARARRILRQPEGSGVPCSFQLLASMSQCLSVDPLSFSVWRQLYTKHLAQSRWVPVAGGAPAR